MKTVIKLIWQIIIGKGINLASPELYKSRIKTCRSNECGHYKNPFNLGIEKCGACGCFLKTKCRVDEPYVMCPKGWW
jgi:hypothetical protein